MLLLHLKFDFLLLHLEVMMICSIKLDISSRNYLFILDINRVLFKPSNLRNDLRNSLSTISTPKTSTYYDHLKWRKRKTRNVQQRLLADFLHYSLPKMPKLLCIYRKIMNKTKREFVTFFLSGSYCLWSGLNAHNYRLSSGWTQIRNI